jgi:uroporphyrinogen decarboxylase
MEELSSCDRFKRMYEHRDADRVPITDSPWPATIERWQHQGMPEDSDWVDFFGVDRTADISVDNSPQYEQTTVEETDQYVVTTTSWGVTLRNWKHEASTPEFLDFSITDRDSWQDARERMQPECSRVPWHYLEANHPRWRQQGRWITAQLWFGFDVTHAWAVGTERLLVALLEDPDWCRDMFNSFLDLDLALLDMVWDAGYRFDCVSWPDDMGYKGHQFFSLNTYRSLLKPVHARAIAWAHDKGVYAHLHSCGDVRPFIPELLEIGLDALNPLEVKAGMDPLALKREYGRDLVLHGGVNAVLWDSPAEIEREIRRLLPVLKQDGGYIFSSDHSVPSSVTVKDFRRIVALAREVGSYD